MSLHVDARLDRSQIDHFYGIRLIGSAFTSGTTVGGTPAVLNRYGIHMSDLISDAATLENVGIYLKNVTGSAATTINAGLRIGNVTGGTNNWAIKTGDGLVSLGDDVEVTGDVDVSGTVTIADGGLTGVINGATTPVPTSGAGTIMFNGTNFFGWTGTEWRQLDL